MAREPRRWPRRRWRASRPQNFVVATKATGAGTSLARTGSCFAALVSFARAARHFLRGDGEAPGAPDPMLLLRLRAAAPERHRGFSSPPLVT